MIQLLLTSPGVQLVCCQQQDTMAGTLAGLLLASIARIVTFANSCSL